MALLGFLQQEVLPGGLGVAQLWPGLARGSQASAHAWSDKDRTGTETGHRDGDKEEGRRDLKGSISCNRRRVLVCKVLKRAEPS